MSNGRLIFMDCEATGPAPGDGLGEMTEFGAVHHPSLQTFHGLLVNVPREACFQKYDPMRVLSRVDPAPVFAAFALWLSKVTKGKRPIFVSDNPAFDWQWINHGFHKHLGYNPFGYSARRIGDFYAGLCGTFWQTQNWKKLRVTAHTHDPVDDAMGNLEAFERLLKGER